MEKARQMKSEGPLAKKRRERTGERGSGKPIRKRTGGWWWTRHWHWPKELDEEVRGKSKVWGS